MEVHGCVCVSSPQFYLSVLHRKVFHNFNYYFFFFNMMLGIMSCIMRLVKSAAVGLMLVSRIERTIMPEGFEALDSSKTEALLFKLLICCP